jgi:hypothetical protein
MAVQLLRLPSEPGEWAVNAAVDRKAHLIPDWPASARYALIAVARGPGPPGLGHTRAMWVTTEEEMDKLLTRHVYKLLWFTVARYQITEDLIEKTLPDQEAAP